MPKPGLFFLPRNKKIKKEAAELPLVLGTSLAATAAQAAGDRHTTDIGITSKRGAVGASH